MDNKIVKKKTSMQAKLYKFSIFYCYIMCFMVIHSASASDVAHDLSDKLNEYVYSHGDTLSTEIEVNYCQLVIKLYRDGDCDGGEYIVDTTKIDLREIDDNVPFNSFHMDRNFSVLSFLPEVSRKFEEIYRLLSEYYILQGDLSESQLRSYQTNVIDTQMQLQGISSYREINMCEYTYKHFIGSGIVLYFNDKSDESIAQEISSYIEDNCN